MENMSMDLKDEDPRRQWKERGSQTEANAGTLSNLRLAVPVARATGQDPGSDATQKCDI
jgi:hypothetical protein